MIEDHTHRDQEGAWDNIYERIAMTATALLAIVTLLVVAFDIAFLYPILAGAIVTVMVSRIIASAA